MSDEDNAIDDFIQECQNQRNIVQGDFVKRPISVSTVETEIVQFEPYEQRKREFECKSTYATKAVV